MTKNEFLEHVRQQQMAVLHRVQEEILDKINQERLLFGEPGSRLLDAALIVNQVIQEINQMENKDG